MFDVAVCLIIFKRGDKACKIIDQIAQIKPFRIYLIGDGPRNDDEVKEVEACRKLVESHITWNCEIIKYYAKSNRGVYENIAGGAKWVFEREPYAIFLEDDNFPSLSFFQYCKEMLLRYKEDNRILWICGTNYLGEYSPIDDSDYVFTQMMLPCGWASWSSKFINYYDGNLDLFSDEKILSKVKFYYKNKILYAQNLRSWKMERKRILSGKKPISWDFQMSFSLRVHDMLGIAPKYNQITNIGDDSFSTHGHSSMKKIMTQRFCYIPAKELSFPLIHPKCVLIDPTFENKTEKIIIQPLSTRIKSVIGPKLKKILGISDEQSIKSYLKKLLFNR